MTDKISRVRWSNINRKLYERNYIKIFNKKHMNPIIKRGLKGLGAVCLAFIIKFAIENVGNFNLPIEWIAPITAILLAIEKSFKKNL